MAPEIATDTIRNDGTLEQYRVKIDALVSTLPKLSRGHGQKSELHRTLIALDAIGGAGTCEQISAKSADLGIPVRKYNTNRALKSAPEFAERVKRSGRLLQYKLTARGQRLLDLLNLIDTGATKTGVADNRMSLSSQVGFNLTGRVDAAMQHLDDACCPRRCVGSDARL